MRGLRAALTRVGAKAEAGRPCSTMVQPEPRIISLWPQFYQLANSATPQHCRAHPAPATHQGTSVRSKSCDLAAGLQERHTAQLLKSAPCPLQSNGRTGQGSRREIGGASTRAVLVAEE
jgi:hypothetical protein